MATPRIRYNPPFTRYLIEQGVLKDQPFSLADVGASGGIEKHWLVFGSTLRAWGFDPLVAEIARLNATKSSADVSYHALRITRMPRARRFSSANKLVSKNNQPFTRTSSVRAISALKMNYVQKFFDPAGSGKMTDEETSLDEFFAVTPHTGIDFIKIDTDGADYDVLLGAERIMAESPCLGVFIEIQFHGEVSADANLFCNIDSLLRTRGFSLFDIEVYRYSRSVLPKGFAYDIPAQTIEGQVLYGDALFLRDAGDPDYEKMWDVSLPARKILKLAAVSEVYGLEDYAAEVLCKYRKELESLVDVRHCLDLLVPEFGGKKMTFVEYGEAFERNPRRWFPQASIQPAAALTAGASPNSEGEGSRENEQLQIVRLQQQLEEWRTFWRSVENSMGWRFLGACRRLRDVLAPRVTRRRQLYESLVAGLRRRL
jgi:FkbM family methyltransferase